MTNDPEDARARKCNKQKIKDAYFEAAMDVPDWPQNSRCVRYKFARLLFFSEKSAVF